MVIPPGRLPGCGVFFGSFLAIATKSSLTFVAVFALVSIKNAIVRRVRLGLLRLHLTLRVQVRFVACQGDDDVGVALPLQLLHPLLRALECVLCETRERIESVRAMMEAQQQQQHFFITAPDASRARTLLVMSKTTIAAAAPR